MPSEPVSDSSTRAERIDYLLKQLDLAHRRNDLVDGLRYLIFQVLFAFHGVILGATALGGTAVDEVRDQLGDMRWVLPAVVLNLKDEGGLRAEALVQALIGKSLVG